MEHRAVVFLLIGLTCLTSTRAIQCYTCSGSLGSSQGNDCLALRDTPKVEFAAHCSMEYYSSFISRNGAPVGENSTNYCTDDRCYCNTDLCNSMIPISGSLTCFVCESAFYFDTGCGEILNPSASYVNKETGCTSCGKSASLTKFKRSCLKSVYKPDRCTTSANGDTQCFCSSTECNAAHKQQTTSFICLLLLGSFISL